MEIYSCDSGSYSVAMMHTYLNTIGNDVTQCSIDKLIHNMKFDCWGDEKSSYSPMDVIAAPNKYTSEIKRIEKADCSYPIIVWKGFVVDGMHRLTKTIMEDRDYILITEFDDELLERFSM